MNLRGLLGLLEELPAYRKAREALDAPSGPASARLSVPQAPWALLLAGFSAGRTLLVVTARPEDAARLMDELTVYLDGDGLQGNSAAPRVLLFPESEALPFERLDVDDAVIQGRLRALAALAVGTLLSEKKRSPQPGLVVIASVAALLQRTLAHEAFVRGCHLLQIGQRVQTQALLTRWTSLGYALEPTVEAPGMVSRRGGILDIWPPHQALPARMELLGSVIESLRLFYPSTQRSEAPVKSIWVTPAQEMLPRLAPTWDAAMERRLQSWNSRFGPLLDELEALREGRFLEGASFYTGFFNTGSILDYLGDNAVLVLEEPLRITQAGEELQAQEEALRHAKEERGELPPSFLSPHWPWAEVQERLQGFPRRLHLEELGAGPETADLGFAPAPSFWGRPERLAAHLKATLQEGARTVIASSHAQRLNEVLRDQGVPGRLAQSLDEPPDPRSLTLVPCSLPEGFVLPVASGPLLLLTDAEVFGHAKRRRPLRPRPLRRESFLPQLQPGSYVVHIDHGVGRFVGTQVVTTEQGPREYLTVEYAEGDKLYVPPEHLDRLSPYLAPSDAPPTLTRLGTQEWTRAKERAQKAAREMAKELLQLYAARQVLPGFAFSPDTPWQRELEDSFPYQETLDQLQAVEEVKTEMERPQPMDRLVCGDVGYGKTEIALRAAFKAVQDGRQAAFLCPTTILAQQHYATFAERLAPFPVRVEVLSRFRTHAEQRAVIDGLRAGRVDIAIGTHRIIQKDVVFRDLGLVIVDDEQRFGVAHKERFKRLRREVDVLTLSATPIPRTLYMALSGIRDMSTIETPPESRQPVRTYVSEYSDALVQETILRELDRGGQVFFVHNRIQTLPEWVERLRALAPQARVAMAHGRMDEEELATVMEEFGQGKLDVLACTTIIEAGLDLPNVNTLIVHRPELLGLAQMYQLRGRVGRGAHRAYAYFLVPRGHRLTEAAEKRLRAILAHQELGAGFRIAMQDLEIRGAGNLLGAEQSGHVRAVGFDLYVRLLEEAAGQLKTEMGQAPPPQPVPKATVSLPLPAFIPEEYIPALPVRLEVYQRLAWARKQEELEALAGELRDRFGPLPGETTNLLYGVRVKLLAAAAGVESVAQEGGHLALRLREPLGGARLALQRELGSLARVGEQLVRLELHDGWQEALGQALERMEAFRQRLLALVGNTGS